MIDELGYLSLGQEGSHLFFQVISHRHEQRSTMLTTNLPFADWGKVFDSTTVATAIADRLVANSEVLILEGESYRKMKKSKINHHWFLPTISQVAGRCFFNISQSDVAQLRPNAGVADFLTGGFGWFCGR